MGSGSLVESPNWADSAVVGVGPAPAGMKWIGLISDVGYLHHDTLVVESTVQLKAGETLGTFPIGVVVTKESFFPSTGDWFGPNAFGADSSMNNMVTVTLADYRGFDTFGETTVVFCGCVCVMLLLRCRRDDGGDAS